MAKKKTKVVRKVRHDYKRYLIPSIVGAGIAWIFSGSMELGAMVFIAVYIGNVVGYSMRHD